MEIILHGNAKYRRLLKPALKDILFVENIDVRKVKKSEAVDFKNTIVSKPWGVEYLCGHNKNVEVWELYINPRAATSFHCHPNKDTLNILLEGKVLLETIKGKEILKPGDFKLLKAGVLHKTINFNSRYRARVLEIESPPNKYDLIRLKDDYGRESIGYTKFHMRRIANKYIKIHSYLSACFVSEKKQFYILRKFIPGVRKINRAIAIYELLISSLLFKDRKDKMLNKFETVKLNNLILIAGSLSLRRGNTILKLLPGSCIFDVPLKEFNWSAKTAQVLIW